MKRVLLLLPATGYRNDDFLAAAKKLGVEIVAAADYCHRLAPSWGMPPIMALHFDRPEQAAETVLREIDGRPDAVLAVDDSGVELAALLAQRLGPAGNPVPAVRRVRDKLAFRRLLGEHGFLCPRFHHLPAGEDPRRSAVAVDVSRRRQGPALVGKPWRHTGRRFRRAGRGRAVGARHPVEGRP